MHVAIVMTCYLHDFTHSRLVCSVVSDASDNVS